MLNIMLTSNQSCCCLIAKSCQTLATPWTVPCQAPLCMGFPRLEYWSGWPFPSPGDLPIQGSNPKLSPEFTGRLYQWAIKEALNQSYPNLNQRSYFPSSMCLLSWRLHLEIINGVTDQQNKSDWKSFIKAHHAQQKMLVKKLHTF